MSNSKLSDRKKQRDRTNFPVPNNKFRFVTEAYIQENYLQLTPHQSSQLRSRLPRSIYWMQITDRGLVHWNWILLHSYLLWGADSSKHQALLEEYMANLPQTS